MLSVNWWSSVKSRAGWPPADWGLVRDRSYNGRLAKATIWNWEANTQGQIQWQTRKGSYEGYLHKGSLGNCGWGRVFWMTDLEKCKTADLVRESKRRFGLVVRLIAIKYNERLLCYLSSYINLMMSDLWLDLDLWPRDGISFSSHLLFNRYLVVIIIIIIICFWYYSNIGSWSY